MTGAGADRCLVATTSCCTMCWLRRFGGGDEGLDFARAWRFDALGTSGGVCLSESGLFLGGRSDFGDAFANCLPLVATVEFDLPLPLPLSLCLEEAADAADDLGELGESVSAAGCSGRAALAIAAVATKCTNASDEALLATACGVAGEGAAARFDFEGKARD
ncbi:hypothetical protein BCR44DRAFT_1311593 [Catenaria anguillulae PL171]|uniref:Uncharacterized protein n=1 Tax=Catenaria anguillulae PL171 TaxID=765915 RepID=A0A1Y2H7I9_9FUNG|nr:hypothetical protein BCR44DRAFT_1311593 [Catenaria anguillulae PL171]